MGVQKIQMNNLTEDLMAAWLKLRATVDDEQIVSDMSYNESLICNILLRHYVKSPEQFLTATDLCRETRMLKSQMNRTLKSLEQKQIIVRERSSKDRRHIYIKFNIEQSEVFAEQHRKNRERVDAVVKKIGEEKARELLEMFVLITEAVEEILKER